jgi:phage gpG-like protein
MIQLNGVEAVQSKFEKLSELAQQRLVAKTANILLASAKQRIDTQTDVTGSAFKERKNNANKRKMLLGLKDRLVVSVSGNQAVISFTDKSTSAIAYKQQFGASQTFNNTAKSGNNSNTTSPATIRQATELINLGFRLGNKKPSVKMITQKYTISQAGFLVRKLRAWHGITTRTSWTVALPARSFLAVTDDDLQQIRQSIIDEIESAL